MAGKIFINYRRTENGKDAIALHQVLQRSFPKRRLFIDLHGLDGGVDWLHELEKQVAASDALVALISPGWADIEDAAGNRRLDDPNDFVRVEIAEALRRKIPVIPIQIDDAPLPSANDLPPPIQQLAYQQAMPLRLRSFDADADNIAQALKARIAERRRGGVSAWVAGLVTVLALAGGMAIGPYVLSRTGLEMPSVTTSSTEKALRAFRARLAKSEAEAGRWKDKAGVAVKSAKKTARELASARAKLKEQEARIENLEREAIATAATLAKLRKNLDKSRKDAASWKDRASAITKTTKQRDLARAEVSALERRIGELEKELAPVRAAKRKAAEVVRRKAEEAARREARRKAEDVGAVSGGDVRGWPWATRHATSAKACADICRDDFGFNCKAWKYRPKTNSCALY